MRPVQATGRPATPVIPPGWSEAPRTVMQGTWTARVTIRRPGGTRGPFDPTTGTYPVVPHDPHYTGAARIQALSTQEQERLVAADQVTLMAYRIVVALSAVECAAGDVVEVLEVDASIGDQLTTGQELTVQSLTLGSLAWERDLICIFEMPEGGES